MWMAARRSHTEAILNMNGRKAGAHRESLRCEPYIECTTHTQNAFAGIGVTTVLAAADCCARDLRDGVSATTNLDPSWIANC